MSEQNRQNRRRRQAAQAQNAPEEKEIADKANDDTGMRMPTEQPPIRKTAHSYYDSETPVKKKSTKHTKKDKRVPWLIAFIVLEGLLIALMLCFSSFYVLNGWSDNGIAGLVSGVFTTPSPAPTATPTPTPVVEYVYITPEPTATPSPTPIPTAIPTPLVEYVYITPEPTAEPTPTPMPTPSPSPVIEYVYITPSPTPVPTAEPTPEIYNSDFVFRNDIHFGDSRERVEKKETFSPMLLNKPSWCAYGRGTIEGFENSEVDYQFNSEDKLVQVLYHLDFYPSNGQALSNWRTETSKLKQEYGEPYNFPRNKYYRVVGEAITGTVEDINSMISFGGKGVILYRNEWVVDYGDHFIKIDHVLYQTQPVNSKKYDYHNVLSYLYCDDIDPQYSNSEGLVLYTPKPTATPIPVPNLEVSIRNVKFGKNSIGTPKIYVQFKNTSAAKTIDRIDFAVECYDVYGSVVKGYGYYDYTECYYDDSRIAPGKTTPSDYYWTLYGFDETYKAKIAITRYHTTNGETVTIPEQAWKWEMWTPN